MENVELFKKISTFFKEQTKEIQLYFIIRETYGNEKGEFEYYAYNAALSLEQCDGFIQEIENKIYQQINNKSLVDFDVSISEDDCIEIIKEREIYYFDKVVRKLNPIEADTLSSVKDFDFGNVWGYVFVIVDNNGKMLITFRKNTKGKFFKNNKILTFTGSSGIKLIKEQNLIVIDDNIDAFSFDDDVYIINRYYFQQFFSFNEVYVKYVQNSLKDFGTLNIIENFDEFIERCLESNFALRKMVEIVKSDKLNWLKDNIEQAQEISDSFGLKINFDGNKIVYNKECSLRDILTLLNGLCVTGAIDGKKLIASKVKEVGGGAAKQ